LARGESRQGEPTCFAMVKRDGITIMLKSVPGKKGFVRPNHKIDEDACWDAYLRVTGVAWHPQPTIDSIVGDC
jgi:hypothetical protein